MLGRRVFDRGGRKVKKVGRMSDQNAFYTCTRLSKKNFFKKERKASD